MFEAVGLAEVKAQEARLAALCAALDPDAVPAEEVATAWASLAAMERLVAGARCRLGRRVDDAGGWRRAGDRSAAHWLARTAGVSVAQARSTLETSRQLTGLPEVTAAVSRGDLSSAQAEIVAGAAAVAPAASSRLVELAGRRSLGELRDECARTAAAADRDAEARHRRIHDARTCRRRTTADGAGEILYRSTVDEVAEIFAVIQHHAEREFRQARIEGRREPPDAYAADGLLALARAAIDTGDEADTGAGSDGTERHARPTGCGPVRGRLRGARFRRLAAGADAHRGHGGPGRPPGR